LSRWDAYVEHVYGPGYVDEFVATVAEDGATQYILQDANYNVMALISGGPPPGGSAPPAGTVLEQYQYSPYGELIVRDQLASKPTFNPIGHQGLFYQRHDAGPHLPPLDVAAVGLYYNRARFYLATLGRFVQKDMNETALPIATALAMNADAIGVLFAPFEPQMHYGDGMNLFAYLRSNPINGLDPSGLDEIDDLIAELTGHKVAAIGLLAEGARWASLGLNTAVGIAASLIPGAGIYDAYKSGVAVVNGEAGFWDFVAVGFTAATGARDLFKAFKWGRRLFKESGVLSRLIQSAKRKARGFRSTRYLITMVYLIAGKLDFKLPAIAQVTHTK